MKENYLIEEAFPGMIVNQQRVNRFVVQKCPGKHAGRVRVLVNYKKRDGAKRFQIVKILAPTGKSAHAAVIGHYEDPNHIFMDYDLRDELGLVVSQEVQLEIKKCGLPGAVYWYMTDRDPMVRIPAILAIVSLCLGVLGLFLGLKA
jgi:hypothetical protein